MVSPPSEHSIQTSRRGPSITLRLCLAATDQWQCRSKTIPATVRKLRRIGGEAGGCQKSAFGIRNAQRGFRQAEPGCCADSILDSPRLVLLVQRSPRAHGRAAVGRRRAQGCQRKAVNTCNVAALFWLFPFRPLRGNARPQDAVGLCWSARFLVAFRRCWDTCDFAAPEGPGWLAISAGVQFPFRSYVPSLGKRIGPS